MTFIEKPRYRLTGAAYIGDVLYDPENTKDPIFIESTAKPGRVWEPVNDAARDMVERFPPNTFDPIRAMTSISKTEPVDENALRARIRAELQVEANARAEATLRERIRAELVEEMAQSQKSSSGKADKRR